MAPSKKLFQGTAPNAVFPTFAAMKKETIARFEAYVTYRNAFLEEMASSTAEALGQLPKNGGWSANQVVHHLIMAEGGSLQYLKKKLSANSPINKAGMGAFFRSKLLTTFLALPLKIKAPSVVGNPSAEVNFPELTTQWQQLDQRFLAFFESLPEERFHEECFKHPLSGRMSFLQMIDFFEGHFNRHKKQIHALLYS